MYCILAVATVTDTSYTTDFFCPSQLVTDLLRTCCGLTTGKSPTCHGLATGKLV